MDIIFLENRMCLVVLFEEAKNYFLGGVNFFVWVFKFVYGLFLFIKEGQGCCIIDEDDYIYIDFCCFWGLFILGYNNVKVCDLVMEIVVKGIFFGILICLGNELGKFIVNNNCYIDKICFVSLGMEAVMLVLCLVWGIIGKSKVIKFEGCYYGYVDFLLVKVGLGLVIFGESIFVGIFRVFVEEIIVLFLDDCKLLEEIL